MEKYTLTRITSEDEPLKMYGTFVKVRTNGHDRHNESYNVLSETDLDEIADLIEIGNDSQ